MSFDAISCLRTDVLAELERSEALYYQPADDIFACHVISVGEQLEVNAAGFVVLVMFDIAHPQLAPDLTTDKR